MALPCYSDSVHAPRDAFKSFDVWAGLDGGCSLTKIAFIARGSELNELLRIHLCSFSDFSSALHHLKTKACLPVTSQQHRCKLFFTGVTAADRMEELRTTFPGWDLVFVSENKAHINGFRFLWSKATDSLHELCFESLEHSKPRNNLRCQDNDVLLFVFGSGLMAHRLSRAGGGISLNGGLVGGYSLLGLSSLLLGICDYDELMLEASRGDRSAIDAKAKDFLTPSKETPYGRFEEDRGSFVFAAPAIKRRKIVDHRREDIAAGLVGMFSHLLAQQILTATAMTGINDVYIVGNTCNSKVFRNSFYKDLKNLCPQMTIEVFFLRSGGLAALGAMTIEEHFM